MQQPAIILDRDGVINQDSSEYIKSVDEFHLYTRSIEAITLLHTAGWPIFIITNQSGIARGYYTEQTLADMHRILYKTVINAGGDIRAIYYCPHHPNEHCECRKPKTGLFEQLALEHNIDLTKSYYIGDKLTDVQAGLAAGCTPILVQTGQGLVNFADTIIKDNDVMIVSDLFDFAHQLCT